MYNLNPTSRDCLTTTGPVRTPEKDIVEVRVPCLVTSLYEPEEPLLHYMDGHSYNAKSHNGVNV